MGNLSLAPYVFFDGHAKEAMEFYKTIFGGKLEIQSMGDVPENVRKQAGNPDKDRVMHAKLEADGLTMFASDSSKASDKSAKVELSVMGDEDEKLTKVFGNLSHGGKVTMPLTKQFWGDKFGMVTDKFGVDWMVNIGQGLK